MGSNHFTMRYLMKILKFEYKLYRLGILLILVLLTACGGAVDGGDSSYDAGSDGGSNGPIGNESVTISWLAPDTYTDGSYMSDLEGHHIYMKVNNGSYKRIHTINSAGLLTHVVENLGPATYTFAVTAFNSDGLESSFSNAVRITL